MKIKQVSFDVWNTLVVANPEYATRRAQLLQMHFPMYSIEEIKAVYTATKKSIDSLAEKCGHGPTTEQAFQRLCLNLGMDLNRIEAKAKQLQAETAVLFNVCPPTVTDSAKTLVAHLKSLNIDVSIASNSNFISGVTMHPYLESQLGSLKYGVYSDLIAASKPSPVFFAEVVNQSEFERIQILHVGDNRICDLEGAGNYGIRSLLIDNPNSLDIQTLQHIAIISANA